MREGTLQRLGADLYFVDNEKGASPLFLINGYTRSHSDFKAMIRFLGERGLRILTCDNRGAGRSEARVPFTIEDMADDIFALLQEVKLQKVSLLGISMGGMIAQKFIEKYSDAVEKVILISTTDLPEEISGGSHGWPQTSEGVYQKMETYFTPEFVRGNKILIKAMVKNIMTNIEDGSFSVQSELQAGAIGSVEIDHSHDPLPHPAMVVHGDSDQIIDVKNARKLASRFENCELNIFENTGHLLIAEKSKELYETIFQFMNKA